MTVPHPGCSLRDSLFPNQFVNVKLLVEADRGVVLIPTASIQRSSLGNFVDVVKSNNTVGVRKLTLGATEGETSWVRGEGRRADRGRRARSPSAGQLGDAPDGGQYQRGDHRRVEPRYGDRYPKRRETMNLAPLICVMFRVDSCSARQLFGRCDYAPTRKRCSRWPAAC
jgi:hypothetical protein